MIERDFKELLQKIELSDDTKKELNNLSDLIIKTITNNINNNVKIIEIRIDEPYKDSYYLFDEKRIDLFITISPKNKSLPYNLLKRANINEVENALIYNLKNNLLYKEQETEIKRNEDLLEMSINGYDLFVHFIYKKESLTKIDNWLEINGLLYEDYLIRRNFQIECLKKYPKFKNTIKLIRYFGKTMYLTINNLEMIKIILSYSLEKYYQGTDYADYLEAFVKGLTDFIDGKQISISEEFYKRLKVGGNYKYENKYVVIDSANKMNNLASDVQEVSLYKKLKTEIISKLPKDGAFIKIDVSPRDVVNNKTIEWHFSIIGSETENSGGEYENNQDNYFMCCYRALLKGLQFSVKEKLGNNITVICDDLTPFSNEKLSYENESRFANVKAYIVDNDLAINYEKKK